MDVFAVPGKYRPAADETAHYGKRRLQYGKAERDYGNGDGNDRGRLLHALQRQRAEHEAHEQTAAVPQKNGCGIEVEAQETDNRARQDQGHDRHKRGVADQRDHEDHQGGKQRGTSRQSVQSVNQVKGVGDAQDPQNGQRKPHKPGKMVPAEQDRQDPECAVRRQTTCTPASTCTGNLKYGPTGCRSSYRPSRKIRETGQQDGEQRARTKTRNSVADATS